MIIFYLTKSECTMLEDFISKIEDMDTRSEIQQKISSQKWDVHANMSNVLYVNLSSQPNKTMVLKTNSNTKTKNALQNEMIIFEALREVNSANIVEYHGCIKNVQSQSFFVTLEYIEFDLSTRIHYWHHQLADPYIRFKDLDAL